MIILKCIFFSLIAIFILECTEVRADFFSSNDYWEGKKLYQAEDYKGAFDSWIRAAEQGVPEAQFFIASLYQAGHGVQRDYQRAIKWYRLSAEKGFSPSQVGMGNMNADGLGLNKNNLEAHMWFNIATANGNLRGQYNLKKLEKRMTKIEIQRAEELASNWLEKYPQPL